MKKTLTIGIAVYNIKEEYLRACIESAAKAADSTAEILIIDDCSDDLSGEICREYSRRDDRIRYIRCEENIGISAVRNKIIAEANGEWIMFADGDDMVSDKLSEAFTAIKECGRDMVIFGYSVFEKDTSNTSSDNCGELIDIDGDTIRRLAASALVRYDMYKTEKISVNLHPNSVWAAAYRRGFLLDNKIHFDESLKTAEDSVFNAKVYFAMPNCAYLPVQTYFYRINPLSVMQRYNADMKSISDSYLNVIQDIINKEFYRDQKIKEYFWIYRCGGALSDNLERDIFHRDNPKSKKERENDFLRLMSDKYYKDAVQKADIQNCKNHKLRLTLKLAKPKSFNALEFVFRHRWVFRLYGGIKARTNRRK